MEYQPFSVAMCVYSKDNADWFDQSIKSISSMQTVKPTEIVLIVDGPVPDEIESVLVRQSTILPTLGIKVVVERFAFNQGHGIARRKSIDLCTNELVALMDADDISLPTRFEVQLKSFRESNADVIGGDISEFLDEEHNVICYREVPKDNDDIVQFAKSRCPMNQMTIMLKKTAYNQAGGYVDWYQNEDYYLWLRMMKNKSVLANVGSVLVNVRVGKDMYKRRGGIKYFKSERKLQKFMLREKMISFPRYCVNCFKRFVVQVLLPNGIRAWAFKKFARSSKDEKI